jgi:hypothetical protein
VVQVPYTPGSTDDITEMIKGLKELLEGSSNIGLITYGVRPSVARKILKALLSSDHLKVCVHFCPSSDPQETAEDVLSAFAIRDSRGRHIP